jgi:hypothetical protein
MVEKMFSLAMIGFSLFGFISAIYHFLKKQKLLNIKVLTAICGKISQLDISSFGRSESIKIRLAEHPKTIFTAYKHAYAATAKADLERDVKIGETVWLSLKKDEKSFFETQSFYALKTNQQVYLTVENYNLIQQKYHAGNFSLGLIGGLICLLIAILPLIF